MLSVRNMQFRYPHSTFELNVPRFDLEVGQHTAIVGPSGCGKTTFLNLLSGIIPLTAPSAGEVKFQNVVLPTAKSNEMRRFRNDSIGMVFQDFRLIEYLSLKDNILLPVTLSSRTQDDDWERRADVLIRKVGLEGISDRPVSAMSRGEQQRVAVCRALLRRPTLVLADEPTANLDSKNATDVLDLLFEQANEIDATVVAVTHADESLSRFPRVLPFREINTGGNESPA